MYFLIYILLGLPALLIVLDFSIFVTTRDHLIHPLIYVLIEILSVILFPLIYIGIAGPNECCVDVPSIFSPDHQLTIGVIIAFCLISYFYSSFREQLTTPIIEIALSAFLFIGIVLNIFIFIHLNNLFFALAGNLPIILLYIMALIKNHITFLEHAREDELNNENMIVRLAWNLLNLQPILKFPIILILCLPIMFLLTAILLLFGQKPDSFIRAFTETYKHGFSQWDYKCENVQCGGHYLCSVAANGHSEIVNPQRYGFRNGRPIICNRQLLISNAFEDLLKERMPFMHKHIRKLYDIVGDLVIKKYDIFNNKYFSDFVYIVMKPLEWIFLLVLYTFDRNPENRIAIQYLSKSDRTEIDRLKP